MNIVPLLGFVDGVDGSGLVSPWYPKGNVINFIRHHPDANREIIVRDPFISSGMVNVRPLYSVRMQPSDWSISIH